MYPIKRCHAYSVHVHVRCMMLWYIFQKVARMQQAKQAAAANWQSTLSSSGQLIF